MKNNLLKKYTAVLLAMAFTFTMTACSLTLDPSDDGNDLDTISVTVNIDYPDASEMADISSTEPSDEAADAATDETEAEAIAYPEDINDFVMHVEQSATVMEVLQSFTDQEDIPLSIDSSYVVSISDVEQTNSGRWVYEINGVKIADDATKRVAEDGDVITWKYVKL